MTVLYTRWRLDHEPNFNYQNFLLKNSVKLCLRLSYIVQNSFHFDEIFHIKFKLPILVLYVTSGNFSAKITRSL